MAAAAAAVAKKEKKLRKKWQEKRRKKYSRVGARGEKKSKIEHTRRKRTRDLFYTIPSYPTLIS